MLTSMGIFVLEALNPADTSHGEGIRSRSFGCRGLDSQNQCSRLLAMTRTERESSSTNVQGILNSGVYLHSSEAGLEFMIALLL